MDSSQLDSRWASKRQSSRRRRNPTGKGAQASQSQEDHEIEDSSKLRRSWRTAIVIYPLTVCLLIIATYLYQSYTFDSLLPLVPFRILPEIRALDDPNSPQARMQLHPESHAYRQPQTQYINWTVTSGQLRPDGVAKTVYLVNGLFPGPTIEARPGDTLVITVANALESESISIHWHGLHIENSMDGTSGVTQSAILPDAEFVYRFTIPNDQSGTFWYHGHSGVHRADGLYGGLIIHAPTEKPTVRGLIARKGLQYKYDKELLLLVGDWYHRPADQVLSWFMRAGSGGNEPVPDSLLINGIGSFDCAMAVPARPVDCAVAKADPLYIRLDRRFDYRIRVVNTGSLAGFTLTFEREQLELIQLDSYDVEHQGVSNSAGILYPGQRMDLILYSSRVRDEQSSVTIELDPECFKYPNPALNPVQVIPINQISKDRSPKASSLSPVNLDQVASSSHILAALPVVAEQVHVVYTKIQKLSINENVPYGFFNLTSWRPQTGIPLVDLPRERWDKSQFSLSTGPEPVWVDLVVNNLDEGPHPFHLHGHHFYVLAVHQAAIGWGSYNPFVDELPPGLSVAEARDTATPYNLSRAIFRDTVEIPSRGYAVLRFRAKNPGIWLFHCHILWHLASGMAMLVDVMRA